MVYRRSRFSFLYLGQERRGLTHTTKSYSQTENSKKHSDNTKTPPKCSHETAFSN